MNDPLRTTLSDASEFLDEHGVKYALVGGLAASIRGQVRVTADVDMIIAADLPKALELLAQLPSSQFMPLFAGAKEVVETAFILPLRHRVTGVKVDLAVGLSGFERQAIERATIADVEGLGIAVATSEDLLIMKVLAGRAQDDQDLRGIVETQADSLDWNYCMKLATDLGDALGQDLVSRVLQLRESASE